MNLLVRALAKNVVKRWSIGHGICKSRVAACLPQTQQNQQAQQTINDLMQKNEILGENTIQRTAGTADKEVPDRTRQPGDQPDDEMKFVPGLRAQGEAQQEARRKVKGEKDLVKLVADLRAKEEVHQQRIKDLESEIVLMKEDHERHNLTIDSELAELYSFVEQQKDAMDRSCSESEKYKDETKDLRSSLVRARYMYFSQTMLLRRVLIESVEEMCELSPFLP